jgi:hypothetical protein
MSANGSTAMEEIAGLGGGATAADGAGSRMSGAMN